MTFIDLFYLNDRLIKENRFTETQWTDIINEGFTHGNEWDFDNAVEYFYTHCIGFEYVHCEDLVTDIQNGDADDLDPFIHDVSYYFNNRL